MISTSNRISRRVIDLRDSCLDRVSPIIRVGWIGEGPFLMCRFIRSSLEGGYLLDVVVGALLYLLVY